MQKLYQTGALCRPSVRRSLGRSVTKSNQPIAQYKSHVTKPVAKPHGFVTESVTKLVTKPVTKYHQTGPTLSKRVSVRYKTPYFAMCQCERAEVRHA